MRRIVRPLRAPAPSRADPLAVVSVMSSPFRDPSGPVASLARPCASAGVDASIWRFRAAPFIALPARSMCPRALLLHVCGLRRARGLRVLAWLPRVVAFGAQRGYLCLEVGQRLEAAVDRGESQVGDLVELAERAQDRQADVVRWDLSAATAPDHVLHPLGQDRELILADRPALAGAPDASDDLVPVERLGDTAALGHHEDDRLLGREAAAAGRARPPAADRRAVLGRPAVDDPAVRMPAVRAVHAAHLPSGARDAYPNTTTGELHRCNS